MTSESTAYPGTKSPHSAHNTTTNQGGAGTILTVSTAWRTTYPQAHVGTLAMRDVANPRHHPALQARKQALEEALRARFAGQGKAGLAALPAMRAYRAYYKRFKKTYHVLLQLRSVVLKGKPLPSVAALVEAMFMAELDNGLLTAGHDLDKAHAPLSLDVAGGDERYVLLNGREQELKPGDMIMSDTQGVICSVIYGADRRTAIGPGTQRVMFVVYAPAGIEAEAVRRHLEDIRDNVLLIAPGAAVEELHVYGGES
jgi:DNA/RNA-binding domain of Phe-tRNA-synthetase-like protein